MSLAYIIVRRMLETGEPDQDYDHHTFDSIVKALDKAGYPGARHREFDKYQGVYLVVPGVDKFWSSYDAGEGLMLIPENDPKSEAGEHIEIPTVDENGNFTAQYLIDYINDRYAIKFATLRAQRDAENFIDQATKVPKRRSTRPGK